LNTPGIAYRFLSGATPRIAQGGDKMILKRVTGMIQSNCFIVGNNGQGVVIDPGAETDKILATAEESGIAIKAIVLTHVHVDHIISVDRVRDATGAVLMVHESEGGYLASPLYNGSWLFGLEKTFKSADTLLKDGDVFSYGDLEFKVLHTPGHTPGSICIMTNGSVFTGDTLFRMNVGRTDLGNGDWEALMKSLNVLMKLDDSTVVYPGHGSKTTIGYEVSIQVPLNK
jgi:hydroxyacylglutathione hydrolase